MHFVPPYGCSSHKSCIKSKYFAETQAPQLQKKKKRETKKSFLIITVFFCFLFELHYKTLTIMWWFQAFFSFGFVKFGRLSRSFLLWMQILWVDWDLHVGLNQTWSIQKSREMTQTEREPSYTHFCKKKV